MSELDKIPHESFLSTEQSFIKVPLEQYRKSFRQIQKYIEKDLLSLLSGPLNDAMAQIRNGTKNPRDVAFNLSNRLESLAKKLENGVQEEQRYSKRLTQRLNHLEELMKCSSVNDPVFKQWLDKMVDRLCVDYMLRISCPEPASLLAKTSGIEEFVDMELFDTETAIEMSLKKHSCSECLAWCVENKAALKRQKSDLEFQLRVQEMIEFLKVGKLKDALRYAKKHFPGWSETHLKQIQRAMALFAFLPSTRCSPYKEMYDDSCWDQLILKFRNNYFQLFGLSFRPMLMMKLEAGLAALKTPSCFQKENRNMNCPVCDPSLQQLAKQVPFSHHMNSILVCRLSGDLMNEDNPPMVLPNGYAYSSNALKEMASRNNGKIKCPRTGDSFDLSEVKKCFVV